MADLHTDLFSIRQLVENSKSEKEAWKNFYNLHGISLDRQVAERALKESINKKFSQAATDEVLIAALRRIL